MASKPSPIAASISPQPVQVEAAGRSFTIPVLPASNWIVALSGPEPVSEVFPGLLSSGDFDRILDLMEDGRVDVEDLRKPAFEAVTAASGFRWWEALRLVGMAEGGPSVIGEMTIRGIDPADIPFGRWCAAVYVLATRNLEPKERMKWDAKFSAPPPEAIDEEEDSSFEDMIKGFQGMPGARSG